MGEGWKKAVVRHCPKGNCDVELSYECIGSPSHPAILLVMGLNAQGIVWDEAFCQKLAAKGYYVIRYDNRDVGLSTKFDHMPCAAMWKLLLPPALGRWKEPYTLVDMAEDGVGLLKYLKIDRAHWAGGSMGGMIVQTAAIHFPEKCEINFQYHVDHLQHRLPGTHLFNENKVSSCSKESKR